MQEVTKVEMIVDHAVFKDVLKLLDQAKVSGYTVIDETSGRGDRGESCSDFSCFFSGIYIMTVCTNEKQLNYVTEHLNPYLKKAGGVCITSNAQWIEH
ncbi:MAG: hypothetical protein KA717_24150 [Woronichinia naegeliana WA131]|jgi:nitrogen regulatory protein PII|uniref:Nitrogen regulatory protein P-II n=1 Tax=Woronichinia naegeliana WA131 TaxID=2824559 RepID=A0A977KSK2_9CYAN|nr:MAG: hypothetical protein KA717_23680 [Woronichinia naegeliana WA131]UXE59033.1 MAG: hypothetical protein KA717_24150 [Woronichinia naegeliana WA131]